jgi:hypothetical protein
VFQRLHNRQEYEGQAWAGDLPPDQDRHGEALRRSTPGEVRHS